MSQETVNVQAATPTNPGVQVGGTTPSAPNGGGEMSYGVVDAEVKGFFTTSYDREVVKYGWATTPLNTITRKLGFRQQKSMNYGYWSLGMRKSTANLAESADFEFTSNTDAVGYNNPSPAIVTLKVDNAKAFDKTDQISFVGAYGCNATGDGEIPYMPLNAIVVGHNKSTSAGGNTIDVQFLNSWSGTVIPKDCKIIILGHALAEGDGRVAPHAATPTPTTQFMQKFMTSAAVTNVYLESQKEADYSLQDLVSMNNQQFIEDIEKTYIWSVRKCITDVETGATTWTTGGAIQQMLEGGALVITIKKSQVTDEVIMSLMTDAYIGNTGSTQRYFFTGTELFKAFMLQKDIAKQVNANEPIRKFEYDWSRIRFGAYSLLQTPHPLFDKFGYGNMGMILDMKYVERHVFRAMTEDQLDLMEIGVKDSKEVRCVEISSLLLKYPQCHALVVLEDDAA